MKATVLDKVGVSKRVWTSEYTGRKKKTVIESSTRFFIVSN